MSVNEIVDGLGERTSAGTNDDIDYVAYKTYTDVISRITRTIMVLLIYLIILVVPLIVSLEIVYMCFPIIRYHMDEKIFNVERKGYVRRALGIAMQDAVTAVKIAETTKSGRSPLYTYLTVKVKSIMFLAYILAWVLLGAGDLINFVARLTEGLLQIILGN